MRTFVIVLDSLGVGHASDAKDYNDEGSNTLLSISSSPYYKVENMKKLGIYNIDNLEFENQTNIIGSYGKMQELSKGKDTTTGHWEMMGIINEKEMPTFPNGFPDDFIKNFEEAINTKILCNKPYSGTEVINDYGDEHVKTGHLICYTSADSVFQIAAHEEVVPLEKLYEYCSIARNLLKGDLEVDRVIARPFIGTSNNYTRTTNRHDYALMPPKTALNYLKDNNLDVIGVGKISDIFNGSGITKKITTKGNTDGLEKVSIIQKQNFNGLCFINLVDFDMLYGHRNDIDGYATAITQFDAWLETFINKMDNDDILFITADHGCDPKTISTDHSRECVPLLVYSKNNLKNNLKTRNGFCDLGKTILDLYNIDNNLPGISFKGEII